MGTPAQVRLGKLIKERREARGIYTVIEAARQSAVSRDTWANVENGEPAKSVTYRKIEDTLLWTRGSCGAVLAGGDPAPLMEKAPGDLDELKALREMLQAALDRIEEIQRGR